MKNENLTASARRILRRAGEAPARDASPAPERAPLRRWSVAELIFQATLLGHPATGRTSGA